MLSDTREIWQKIAIESQHGKKLTKLNTVSALGKTAAALHSEVMNLRRAIEVSTPLEVSKGDTLLVEFKYTTLGIEVKNDSRVEDEPEYWQTDVRWWRQAGVHGTELPIDKELRLNPNGEVGFLGHRLELDHKASNTYGYPVFYVYNQDRSMRVLHGIGHTKVSIETTEVASEYYSQPPPEVPESERHRAIHLLSNKKQLTAQ